MSEPYAEEPLEPHVRDFGDNDPTRVWMPDPDASEAENEAMDYFFECMSRDD